MAPGLESRQDKIGDPPSYGPSVLDGTCQPLSMDEKEGKGPKSDSERRTDLFEINWTSVSNTYCASAVRVLQLDYENSDRSTARSSDRPN